MKQVAQRLRDGAIEVLDVPEPALTPETVLVDVRASLLSVGTERSKVKTGQRGLIGKARSRPDQVAQVVEKARSDGVVSTLQAVRARLDQPSPLGYSASGIVLAVGASVRGISVGDRVAIGGGEHAVHAEIDRVPGNLCVRLPESVGFEEGAFATVGAIAMHGIRQAESTLGERVAVIGLGLVGQLSGLLLRAAGCTVVGVDVDESTLRAAEALGSVDEVLLHPGAGGDPQPHGARGCDAALLTAATSSNDPVALAAAMCRDRGRVVVVGDVGLQVPRAPYYEKEIDLRFSRSYGPGRYDREYEERGLDYPVGYVRWTEQRNMEAFVQLVASNRIPVSELITDRVPIENAPAMYRRLVGNETSPLGLIITYREDDQDGHGAVRPETGVRATTAPTTAVSVIGAGSFSQRVLIPGLKASGFTPVAVSSAGGLSAKAAMERFSFQRAATPDEVISEDKAGLVAIATRHSSHATLTAAVLRSGRSAFVEKPPCLTWAELEDLRAARAEGGGVMAVGFNRRHAPLAAGAREHVAHSALPKQILIRVAAQRLPDDSWILDAAEGGGRLLGEGCHFVDLACWLAGDLPALVTCTARPPAGGSIAAAQSFSVTLDFSDGSSATILYTAESAAGVSKEYLEVHSGGRSAVLDDFRRLTLWDGRRKKLLRRRGQDKGHSAQFAALRGLLTEGDAQEGPDPLDTMAVTLSALDAARLGRATRPSAPDR